jgi:hypothetical protein
MQNLTEEGRRAVTDVAQRHGVGEGAAETLLAALISGGGRMAQFSHPDLGGMGQWSQGGMIMVGDMFNHGLKARVDAVCRDLAVLLQSHRLTEPAFSGGPAPSQSQSQGSGAAGVSLFASGSGVTDSGQWWPTDLGAPASTGAQNDMRYGCFPEQRRLVIESRGRRTVYDTGEHRISGFGQQQSGDQALTFTSQHGPVRLTDLPVIEGAGAPKAAEPSRPESSAPMGPAGSASEQTDIMATIERLAGLRDKGVLSEDEFAAKKRELLGRL